MIHRATKSLVGGDASPYTARTRNKNESNGVEGCEGPEGTSCGLHMAVVEGRVKARGMDSDPKFQNANLYVCMEWSTSKGNTLKDLS